MSFLLSEPVSVSPVLVELLDPGGRVAAQVADQPLILVARADMVLQVGEVVTPVLTVATLEHRLGGMIGKEMFPPQ